MARFDVYANPDRHERKHTPFVLDLQNSFLDMLDTFIVVPLRVVQKVPLQVTRVQPRLMVNGQEVVMDTPMIATFPKRAVGPAVANLRSAQFDIQDALDILFGEH